MNVLLPLLAVAFAALCVWLTVRIINRKERWAKWTLVGTVVGVPILYVASFGPACWWFTIPSGEAGNFPGTNDPLPPVRARQLYWAIGWMAIRAPRPIERRWRGMRRSAVKCSFQRTRRAEEYGFPSES
jgi:hypothetical protein